MEIVDVIRADEIEDRDFIAVRGEPVEVISKREEGDDVILHVYSHDTGDTKDIVLPWAEDVEVITFA